MAEVTRTGVMGTLPFFFVYDDATLRVLRVGCDNSEAKGTLTFSVLNDAGAVVKTDTWSKGINLTISIPPGQRPLMREVTRPGDTLPHLVFPYKASFV